MNVGLVCFNKRDGGTFEGIAQCDAAVGVSGGIDDDELDLRASCVNRVNQISFAVGLEATERMTGSLCLFDQRPADIGEGSGPVQRGFTGSKEIQIGSIENE